MNQPYINSEKSYRRGLVLGLSLAEIFLIFMFILLLIAAAIFAESKEKEEELAQKNEKLEQEIVTYQKIQKFFVEEELTFEFVSELVQRNETIEEQKKINAELKKEIEQLKELDELAKQENLDAQKIKDLIEEKREKNELIEENKRLEDENKQLKLDEEMAKELEPLKEIGEMIKEENLSADEAKKIFAEKKDTATLISENESLKTENTKLKIELKGQYPPCWYVEVAAPERASGVRESFIAIYDIKITDTKFVVRKRNVSGTPDIEQGNLDALPKISNSSFNRELDANQFTNAFRPIFEAGNNKKIHDYSCRFSANKYDFTSEKEIWKRNEGIVENLFWPERTLGRNEW